MPLNPAIPGVYIEEIAKFPPSVAQVETAIPAFIGYTERRVDATGKVLPSNTPTRVGSLKEFEERFGAGPRPTVSEIRLGVSRNFVGATLAINHYLYVALRLFYANGGGDCYIVSVGNGFAPAAQADIEAGIDALETYDEPTIILFPDAVAIAAPGANTNPHALYALQQRALRQCELLKDRVTLCDLLDAPVAQALVPNNPEDNFRQHVGVNNLKYGMAYTPWLRTAQPKNVTYRDLRAANLVRLADGTTGSLSSLAPTDVMTNIITPYENIISGIGNPNNPTAEEREEMAEQEENLLSTFAVYKAIINGINATAVAVPPSGAVAGIYAFVDRTRGVWKAPANVSLTEVSSPVRTFPPSRLVSLNIDATGGKSINAIRSFTGKGVLVWGARTLAGNDNEWRYVSVRRFYNMVEESVKKACEHFVFEPNDANTWVRVQAMIENFLTLQWRQGALQGSKQEHAFRVAVGLGKTMTAVDILEGRMIVEIAMAPVRPAEFIILRFSQKMAES